MNCISYKLSSPSSLEGEGMKFFSCELNLVVLFGGQFSAIATTDGKQQSSGTV